MGVFLNDYKKIKKIKKDKLSSGRITKKFTFLHNVRKKKAKTEEKYFYISPKV